LHEVGCVDAGAAHRDDDVVRTGQGRLALEDLEFPSRMTTQRTRAAYDEPSS
jgi:hypothetical protein